jgi:hypothetical protein
MSHQPSPNLGGNALLERLTPRAIAGLGLGLLALIFVLQNT